ncbi:MAG: glutaminyl-peptide cyclotransferase [Bacteroidales bacterium]
MSRIKLKLLTLLLMVFILKTITSCNGGEANGKTSNSDSNSPVAESPAIKLIDFEKPAMNSTVSSGGDVDIQLSLTGNTVPDSVRLYFDGTWFLTLEKGMLGSAFNTSESRLGKIPVKAVAYSGGSRPQTLTRFITVLSDIIPPVERYQVVATYPHDIGAYTQGLLVYDGYFLESTGDWGKSGLRKVEIASGKVLKSHPLESKFFGEGLALLNNKLYQLTWTTNTGFVYDVSTFTLLGTIHYNTEGWGLTTDGERLIMSDGTNKIYFLEPEYFTVMSTVEVFDNKEAVWQLNELEYIDGVLWANIYQTERLVRIDPATGKVLSYIDLSGILDPKDRHPAIDFLNGIAWDEELGKLYVTGKRWPKVYEIKVTR